MGASNVIAAYTLYAGHVPATAMQILAFMAVVSRDEDRHPWYGQGHQALARHALGREPNTAGVRAVERAIRPLAEVGAITTDRKPSVRRDGPHTARYRLHLDTPAEASHVPRKPVDVDPAQEQQRPTVSGHDVPRKPSPRPTVSVPTSHENRVTEEPGGTTRSEIEEEDLSVRADLAVARAPEDDATQNDHDGRGAPPATFAGPGRPPPRSVAKCPDHPAMRGGNRPDGTPECLICWRLGTVPPPPDPDPDPDPPPDSGPCGCTQRLDEAGELWITTSDGCPHHGDSQPPPQLTVIQGGRVA